MDDLLERENMSWNDYYKYFGYRGSLTESPRQQFWRDFWKNPRASDWQVTLEDFLDAEDKETILDDVLRAIRDGFRWLYGDLFK